LNSRRWIGIGLGIVALVVVTFLAGGYVLGRWGHWSTPVQGRELATRFLGAYLASKFPGQRVLVLSNPFTRLPGQPREIRLFEAAELRGLEHGLGDRLKFESVSAPGIRADYLRDPASVFIDPATTTPLSYLVTAAALDKTLAEHQQAQIVVSLIGLPANIRESGSWQNPDGPRFALLLPDLRMVGDSGAVLDALKSGKIAAIVLNKPRAPAEDVKLTSDAQAEFDRRYLLVTPENAEALLRTYPGLF